MCDIEQMFHQFHVKPEDQDYIRFLWTKDGGFKAKPTINRMKIHLFSAASSPGCANYGLNHLATQGERRFRDETSWSKELLCCGWTY